MGKSCEWTLWVGQERLATRRDGLTNLVAVTPQSARRLITLVRHGQSTWNHLGLIQGQNDHAVLTPRGRDEARAAGRALESRNCEDLVTSDLRRTLETAAIIADGLALSPGIDARLRERCFGVLEGQPIPNSRPS